MPALRFNRKDEHEQESGCGIHIRNMYTTIMVLEMSYSIVQE